MDMFVAHTHIHVERLGAECFTLFIFPDLLIS
jgi:hypothetical protein